MRDSLVLAVFLVLVAAAASFGAFFEPGSWYAALDKPPLNPPNWVFGPVWSILYLMIAIAGWWVWRARPSSPWPLALWGSQLALNALWSWLFFGLHRPGLALAEIVLLLGVLVATVRALWLVRAGAAKLLLPYVAWVAFASYLNAGIWLLNR